ncbi:N-acetylmuramoyl-L-alanine amidase family protein [Lysinibacillus antri]|uniref:N-acetylmuramoyl-L-alanine amidase n=1 Tax=Lysinibacillus antri TaxID=2498145 RepID=A0A3S0RXQ3_9BACI|nr:N-acetylmuramoyl-L-alanine amidase [Lysinibacillus antri]RUL56447.1 N-acetylmuramoyl-L-alanine amidase [Lysinibacillus antri]
MIKVGYDAGHGLSTPGKCTPDGEKEWSFNDKIARAFAKELSIYSGVASKRFDDPTGKRDVPLDERTDGANNWGANYYISFHHNGNTSKWGNWTGVETFIYVGDQPKSLALAKAIHPAVVKAYGLRDRGIKQENLHIVRETKMPAILIEGGFMDSTIDIKKLRDDQVLENAGRMIAQAFAKFCGLKKASVPKKEETEVAQQFLNETGRNECKEMIKRGVEECLFTSKHENVDKYNDTELISYSMAYLNRKTK